jgi:hypothetical protein
VHSVALLLSPDTADSVSLHLFRVYFWLRPSTVFGGFDFFSRKMDRRIYRTLGAVQISYSLSGRKKSCTRAPLNFPTDQAMRPTAALQILRRIVWLDTTVYSSQPDMKARVEAAVQRHYDNSTLEARGAEEAQIT